MNLRPSAAVLLGKTHTCLHADHELCEVLGEASANSTVKLVIFACCQVSGSAFRFFSVVDLTCRIRCHFAVFEPAPVAQREERSISVPCCRTFAM